MKHRVCAIIEIVTDDPRLDPDKIDVETPQAAKAIRAAVIASLPGSVDRVVSVLPVELMRFIMETHELASEVAGIHDSVRRPPKEH